MLRDIVRDHRSYFARNHERLDIYSGNLLHWVDKALKAQLGNEAYEQARHRIPPINVLVRIIEKQSKIYAPGVSRQVVGGKDADAALLGWYEDEMAPSLRLQLANEYYNLFKNVVILPTIKAGAPTLKIYPADRFVPRGSNGNVEGVIFKLGKKNVGGKMIECYQDADADRYTYFTEDGVDVTAQFSPEDNPQGLHTLGRLPFTYINKDPNNVVPTDDSDILAMTKLIPILLTDINFAHMFQAFSILIAIDAEANGLKFSPNAVWQFKSNPGTDKAPSITTIQPSADIDGGLSLVANQLALWLNSKGIKPGAVGEISGSNFSSGIAKMLDEMDTSENRNAQVPYFQEAETDLWDLVLNGYHPIWLATVPEFGAPKDEFARGAKVVANFAEQVPLVRRGSVVEDAKKEVEAGFVTNRRALKRINPTLTDAEITALELEIADEKAANAKGSDALNGAQVGSLVEILGQVALGILPQETAKALIQSAFGLSPETVDTIVDPVKPGSVTPEQMAAAK
jgi:hypothetical protein